MRSEDFGPEKGKLSTSPLRSGSVPTVTTARLESDHSIENESTSDEFHGLARKLTTQSKSAPGALFPIPADDPLNPNSPDFDARKWTKAFLEIRKNALDNNSPKKAGVAFKNLDVYGYGTETDFQITVGNIFLQTETIARKLLPRKQHRVDILRGLEGVVHSGEMVAVLGPPGSGCSTFLKSIAGDTHGFYVADDVTINYQGIHPKQMQSAFRGEAIYTAEFDHHFPQMTVGDTLYFAARARCPKNIPEGVSRREYAEHLRDVIMAMFGISHTKNTRGLDSANAVEFCRTLRTQADFMGCTSFVAIYQAPQDAYDVSEPLDARSRTRVANS